MTAVPRPRARRSHLVAGALRLTRRLGGHPTLAPIPQALLDVGGRVFAARARDESAAGLRAPHPLVRTLLERFLPAHRPFSEMPLPAARAAYRRVATYLPPERFAAPVPFTLTVDGHKVGIRVHGPGRADLPVVCYFHGGGFVLGDLDTAEPECGAIASASDAAVVSVGYPLAPEQRFPVPVEVSIAAVRQVMVAPERFGIVGGGEMVLAGESAGANIALNCALALRGDPHVAVAGLGLVCPLVDLRLINASVKEFGGEYLLTRDDLEFFVAGYLPSPELADDPRASPVLAEDLAGLPRTVIISAGYDPLVDEAEQLARRLVDAGVDVQHVVYERLIHGFLQWRGILPERGDALERIGRLTRPTPGPVPRGHRTGPDAGRIR